MRSGLQSLVIINLFHKCLAGFICENYYLPTMKVREWLYNAKYSCVLKN